MPIIDVKIRVFKLATRGFAGLVFGLAIGFVFLANVAASPIEKGLSIASTTKPSAWPIVTNPLARASAREDWLRNLVQGQLLTLDDRWQIVCQLCTEVPSTTNNKIRFIQIPKSKKSRASKEIRVDFEVLPEANWGDGKPITGDDFRLAHSIASAMPSHSKARNAAEAISEITVDKRNAKRFSMRLAKPDGTLWFAVGMRPVPAHLESQNWENATRVYQDYLKISNYVTEPGRSGLYSGPWLPTNQKSTLRAGIPYITLEKNPGFAGSKPVITRLRVQFVRNSREALAMLASEKTDIVPETDLDARASYPVSDRFVAHEALSTNLEQLTFNTRNPLLADLNLRKSISMLVNRYELAQSIGMPSSLPMASDIFHPAITNGVTRIDQGQIPLKSQVDPENCWYYSPEKSSRLLINSGWTKHLEGGTSTWKKENESLTIELDSNEKDSIRKQAVKVIAKNLSEAGIAVVIKNHSTNEFMNEIVQKLKFRFLAIYAWQMPAETIPTTILDSRQIPGLQNTYTGDNTSGWSNRSVDTLMTDLRNEWVPTERVAKIKEIERITAAEIPFIPLFYRPVHAATAKRVKNFKLPGHQSWSSSSASKWEL